MTAASKVLVAKDWRLGDEDRGVAPGTGVAGGMGVLTGSAMLELLGVRCKIPGNLAVDCDRQEANDQIRWRTGYVVGR